MTTLHRPGFVRAEGTRLVDDAGPVLLRGVGLGNWLLAEGYMWGFGDEQSSPRQIERRIEGLVGPRAAERFWRTFRDRFVTERDIALIAELGFDHVRLPINARGVLDDEGGFRADGFELIDRAIDWSEQHGLRILLDLHGAPGGQTGTNIDDSPNGVPELFMSAQNRAQTIALWQELARRYRDREAVLGYDLLNEPLPNEWQHRYSHELVQLYRDLTEAIREIDQRHLVMYEGSHWATNPEPVAQRFDDNQAVQFHRYWCPPDETSIADFLELRDRIGTPIYMGEGGENTPGWIYAATRLYERHDIGWNFWPWKKLDTVTSPLSARRPDGWELIADPAAEPSPAEAEAILDQYLDAIPADACDLRMPVVDALFARPTIPVPAWAGLRGGVDTPIDELVADPVPEGIWHHTGGRPYGPDERIAVALAPGERLDFAFSTRPAGWEIEADADDGADADADADAALSVSWDGEALSLEAAVAVRITLVDVRS